VEQAAGPASIKRDQEKQQDSGEDLNGSSMSALFSMPHGIVLLGCHSKRSSDVSFNGRPTNYPHM
jgi:hypothetical protein